MAAKTMEELGKSPEEIINTAKKVIVELLDVTHPLVSQVPIGESVFLRVLETTYRRAYHTLAAISLLSQDDMLGGPASILTRSLLEDSISIEYMLAKDKEEKAQRFRDFYYVQAKEDNRFITSQGLDGDPQIKESFDTIEKEFERVKQSFMNKKKELLRSWDGKDVDRLLSELKNAKPTTISAKNIKTISRSYLIFNRKTHFNPIDLTVYFDQKAIEISYKTSMMESLPVAVGTYVRLTTRYIDEISHNTGKDTYHDIGQRANELFAEFEI